MMDLPTAVASHLSAQVAVVIYVSHPVTPLSQAVVVSVVSLALMASMCRFNIRGDAGNCQHRVKHLVPVDGSLWPRLWKRLGNAPRSAQVDLGPARRTKLSGA